MKTHIEPTASIVLRLLAGTLAILGTVPSPGCGRGADQVPIDRTKAAAVVKPAPAGKSAGRSTKDYKLVGIVTGLNREANEVRIRHEEIPGFMGAMTMPFTLKDPAVFERIRAGDKVEGKLRVEELDGLVEDYELTDLSAVASLEPQPEKSAKDLVVSLAGGSPTLTVKPKTLQVGETVPDFAMTDQDGKIFRLSDLRGKVVALTFVYTRCPLPDFCPLMDRKFADLAQRIGVSPTRNGRVRLLSVSFDPEHDTPEVLRKHATLRGVEPPLWTYAVASHAELAEIAPKLGLVYGPGRDEIMHNLCTAVIGPDGKLARLEVGTSRNKWDSADILKTIDSLITPKGR